MALINNYQTRLNRIKYTECKSLMHLLNKC